MMNWPTLAMRCFLASLMIGLSVASAEDSAGRLELVGSVSDEQLEKVTSVEISDDGRFLYTSAWEAATISVYAREADTGELSLVQEITDPQHLNGSTAVRLSPDGTYALSTAFRSKAAVLYRRDPDSGKLTQLDAVTNDVDGVIGLSWAIDSAFSPDSKFVYVSDSRGPTQNFGIAAGSLTVFRITDEDKLEFIEAGQDSSFANIRDLVIDPTGDRIYVVASDAESLVALQRDADTGKTKIRKVMEDGRGDVQALSGAMGVALSGDGRFVYVSSGRFRGDDAVSVYRRDDQDELVLVQELISEQSELSGFDGGNEITVSPDGKNVYAVATVSNAMACFARDPQSGMLKVLEVIPDREGSLSGAAGICVSPDGKFVYVAAEESRSVSIFRRK